MSIEVLQTPLFTRQKKKLTKNQIRELDKAIQRIIQEPEIGVAKRGDLRSIFVYKFPVNKQTFLIAYL